MDIKDQVAIVSGGASGLGWGTARALAAEGAKVVVLDTNVRAAEEVAENIGGLGIGCDVSDAQAMEDALAKSEQELGPAAVAVCCAGIAPAARIVGKRGPMPLDDFARVIQVNLLGSFNLMRLAAAQMKSREPNDDGERGVVVMTASIAAYEGQVGQSAYAASKGGIVGLTLPAAREFANDGIRVCSIAPGLFGTPLLLNMPEEVQNSLAATLPFPKRFGTPNEFAELVLFMVDNPIINGEVVRLDSALRMAPR